MEPVTSGAHHDTGAGDVPSRHARRILLRGGTILTLDPAVDDLVKGDLLVEGTRIAAIAPDLSAAATDEATKVIDVSDMIVLPGLVDTHRHCWQNQLRRLLPNVDLLGYRAATHHFFGLHYTPHDMYVGGYLSALSAIDSGVTCMLDWSHNSRTREHSDAAVQALFDAGIRGVYGFGSTRDAECDHRHPQDLGRIQREFFSSPDQLVTLALGITLSPLQRNPLRRGHGRGPLGPQPDTLTALALAREHGVRITIDGVHGVFAEEGDFASPKIIELGRAGALGDDVTFVHCNGLSDEAWKVIADTGGTVSVAATSEAQLGLATSVPATQDALDHGIRPSLSVDVEIALSGDLFSQMRAVYSIQRSNVFGREYRGDTAVPAPLTVEDVLGFATVEGARANGLLHKVGTLTPGKEADVICIRAEDINTMPLNNAFGTVVLGADSRNVDTVLIGGRVVKFAGELVGVDLAGVRQMVQQSRDSLIKRSGYQLDPLRRGAPELSAP